ncbi:M42 family metallopeptidase [Desulfosporosinus nitroreducens]|uniref:M42 family metallopeptidase n=1 Tax=Desulfosporosinus nitroreducens TaxID=2018668 RepID=A0ABT8QV32_9FIRM|nr:M42 family metallopeptidase [Desulfosporosinus nitroreducens]MCO1601620.1 M42 family metallopeptidase [Desulfosporosinus nitroreducens]MDO0825200.1 M42 family metallopeptidase [Desulfosporosinus nitroreducens]
MINEQMRSAREFLNRLSISSGVSGHEVSIASLVMERFKSLTDEVQCDAFGNVYTLKRGNSKPNKKIMIAAHMDEIGLIVTKIDPHGFLRFTSIGGVDQRTLLSQEVLIHGRRTIPGIIGSLPPHLLESLDSDQAVKMEDMTIDVGLSPTKLNEVIQVGDIITLRRETYPLLNNVIAGKAFDDRAGVVVMLVCLEELSRLHHGHDVIAVATTQEEVGIRGAITSAYTLNPDLAVAIDVTHASTPDTKGQVAIDLGKGPAVALGPNIHPAIYRQLSETARGHRLPIQIEPIPGHSGTDAWVIQVSQAGIPTGLISIPLRYMHTSVETLDMQDVVNSGKLLAHFIASLPDDLEGLLCY